MRIVVYLFSYSALAAAPTTAQQAASGTISGSVIDATTSAPLARATVTLSPAEGDGLLVDARGSSSLARTVATGSDGTYRFADLPIGSYRLRFQRLGYESASIDVRLGDTGASVLSIGLTVLPVRLRPVEVRAHDTDLSTRNLTNAVNDTDRVAAARARQHAFLSTDTRELTHGDIAESATVGGSDVLRSLQRLPGVTPLDDWSAKFWVRGNRWDHDRVYYDDLPLFDPLGVLGRTSGVSADAIAGAFLHPGVRPVSLDGDGATRVDLRSRPASGGGDWRGTAELSQFGASGAVERATADNSAGLLLTAHHSLGHWVPTDAFFSDALSGRTYQDAQATLRGDVALGAAARLEATGLFTQDARTVDGALVGGASTQRWHNAVGRVAVAAPLGPMVTSNSIGVSSYAARSDRFVSLGPIPVAQATSAPAATPRPVTSRIDYVTLNGRAAPRDAGSDVTTAGYDIVLQRSSFNGTNENLFAGDATNAFVSRRTTLDYGSVWGDRRTALTERVTLENGVRLDFGGGHGLADVRPAASTQAAFAVTPATRLSIGASRVHQYVQAIDLTGVGQGQTMPGSWITSGGDVPLMSVDNAMAGVERWVGGSTLLAANVYLRHTTGIVAEDPTPGIVTGRPLFVDATESARGVELSARTLIGPVTGLVAYSYGHATMRAKDLSFPAPADRTQALDATTFAHFAGFNVGAAFTATSGAPYTRTLLGVNTPAVRKAPNAQRLPAYVSLDLSAEYTRTFGSVSLIAFGGAQNVLGRRNATWYEISGACVDGHSLLITGPQCRGNDIVESPVRIAPTLGLRLVVR